MIEYARISSSRKKEFATISRIETRDGKRIFTKSPYSSDAKTFVMELIDKYKYITSHKNLPFSVLNPIKSDDAIEYEFIEGKTYKTIILEKMKIDDTDGVIQLINDFYTNIIDKLPVSKPTLNNKSFKELFHGELDNEVDFIKPGILDLNMDNFIIRDKDIFLIDYEWTWDFAIPKKYLFFRAVSNLLYELSGKSYDVTKIYEYFLPGFKTNFIRAEYNFQRYVSKNDFDYISYYKSYFEKLQEKPAKFDIIGVVDNLSAVNADLKNVLEDANSAVNELSAYKNILYSKRYKVAQRVAVWASRFKKVYYKINHRINISKIINELLSRRRVEFDAYKIWQKNNENYDISKVKSDINAFKQQPLISVVIPVYNVKIDYLNDAIDSIKSQWYENWELLIVDDNSPNQDIKVFLENYEKSEKIKIKYLDANQGISLTSNIGIDMSKGEFVAFLDHDDTLPPFALYEVAKAINDNPQVEFIYSDEDKISEDGKLRFHPLFKPSWSEETFFSVMYPAHLRVFSKKILNEVGGHRKGFEGSQDYDLILRVEENIDKKSIIHIPKILYHWRAIPGSTALNYDEKTYARETSRKSLEEAVKRRGLDATIENGMAPDNFRLKFNIKNNPLVSIIIPVKDNIDDLRVCIESIEKKTQYSNYEILIVDNNSEKKESFDYFQEIYKKHKVITYSKEFNYSAINNYAVKYAQGEHIVFLNNDTEVITPDWLSTMIEYSQLKGIGAVGAKLLYSDNTIQHAGVVLGIQGVAGHSHKYFDKDDYGYMNRLKVIHNVSAVTGACLVIKKSIFNEIGGFNESNLPVAFNDIDLCLRILEAGYRNVFTPYSILYHHESKSRGLEDTIDKQMRFKSEVEYMRNRWPNIEKDLYYSPNLTLVHEDFSIRTN